MLGYFIQSLKMKNINLTFFPWHSYKKRSIVGSHWDLHYRNQVLQLFLHLKHYDETAVTQAEICNVKRSDDTILKIKQQKKELEYSCIFSSTGKYGCNVSNAGTGCWIKSPQRLYYLMIWLAALFLTFSRCLNYWTITFMSMYCIIFLIALKNKFYIH